VEWLCFTGSLPAAGYAAFFLVPCNTTDCAPSTHSSVVISPAPSSFNNGRVTLTLSGDTGFLSHYQDSVTGTDLPLAQSWGAYEGFDGSYSLNGSRAASGAYLFRPARPHPDALAPGAANVTLVSGPVVNFSYHQYGYVTQEMRLWAGGSDVEMEWTVGPVDISGNLSREVITRYTSSLKSNGLWRSDSNCREGQQRRRGGRGNWTANISEPVAGNYAPVSCLTSLTDGESVLAVALDRAEGGTSLADGQLELLVHRRLAHRDGYEPRNYLLDEPGVDGSGLIIRGRHWLLAAPAQVAPPAVKAIAQRAILGGSSVSAVTTFAGLDLAPDLWLAEYRGRVSLLAAPLPPNLHLVTVHAHNDSSWLVRLAHLYELGEDDKLSADASVDLATLFAPPNTVVAAVEVTLPGAAPLAGVQKTTYHTEGGLQVTLPFVPPPPVGRNLTVTLSAMQIRAFLCTIENR